MARIGREEYIRYMAKSLDLPPGVIEKIVAPRREGDDKDGGWRIARMVTLVDLQPYGLGERLTASGWRTILSSIIED
ncbi:MAG: hypothetical protein HYZ50_15165 [Deltaproteobacteria bacterium]|nr:hypothetical protein [Deltaproteobacteria bacterium]